MINPKSRFDSVVNGLKRCPTCSRAPQPEFRDEGIYLKSCGRYMGFGESMDQAVVMSNAFVDFIKTPEYWKAA